MINIIGHWLLVIVLTNGNGIATTTFVGNEKECLEVAQNTEDIVGNVNVYCVPK